MNTMSMESGRAVMENPDDALEQQLLDVSRKREQLQQAELELRAQFFARSEVHRMQNSYEEQSKQHADLVASLQVLIRAPLFSFLRHNLRCDGAGLKDSSQLPIFIYRVMVWSLAQLVDLSPLRSFKTLYEKDSICLDIVMHG